MKKALAFGFPLVILLGLIFYFVGRQKCTYDANRVPYQVCETAGVVSPVYIIIGLVLLGAVAIFLWQNRK